MVIDLAALFVEVSALAHQLRKTDFRAQQGDGLLAPGRRVLHLLHEQGPLTVPTIATKQNSSRQNVQIIANRFKSEGLIESRPNPSHKRSDLLQITDEGRRILAQSTIREATLGKDASSDLEEAQVRAAMELLQRLRKDLGKQTNRQEDNKLTAQRTSQHYSASKEKEAALLMTVTESEHESTLPVNLL